MAPSNESESVCLAIETTCRTGGLAISRGDALLRVEAFDAGARHTVQLISRLDALCRAEGVRPDQIGEVYVSAGPGSFTGTRVGVTVARTLLQANGSDRGVAVPTPLAIAENARELDWRRLAVVLDAREGLVYAVRFERRRGAIVQASEPIVERPERLLERWERPLTVIGEGTSYHDLDAEGVTVMDRSWPGRLPTGEGVWRVGRRLAAAGRCTEATRLLPVYTRKCAAERVWEQRHRS